MKIPIQDERIECNRYVKKKAEQLRKRLSKMTFSQKRQEISKQLIADGWTRKPGTWQFTLKWSRREQATLTKKNINRQYDKHVNVYWPHVSAVQMFDK